MLSTRAKTLQQEMQDKLIFIGPDFWKDKKNPLFKEEKQLFKDWAAVAAKEGLVIRTGRWNIPGSPCVILVDFNTLLEKFYKAIAKHVFHVLHFLEIT